LTQVGSLILVARWDAERADQSDIRSAEFLRARNNGSLNSLLKHLAIANKVDSVQASIMAIRTFIRMLILTDTNTANSRAILNSRVSSNKLNSSKDTLSSFNNASSFNSTSSFNSPCLNSRPCILSNVNRIQWEFSSRTSRNVNHRASVLIPRM
jgi:hypothetical protein